MTPAALSAWCVHLYTASGLVVAAGMAVFIVRGDPDSLRWAFALMLAATLIDATDGWLARRFQVKEVLPQFDGRRLDDIVDFQTYTSLPLLLLWRAGVLPPGWDWVLLAPLVASVYGFCQAEAKTDDGYFLGFPSYWNIVAFYLYALSAPGWLCVALLLLFAVLTFVPSRYLYTTQPGALNRFSNYLSIAWVLALAGILANPGLGALDGERARPLVWGSFFYPAYYLAVSWGLSLGLVPARWARAE
jgi:phosphatidylcholine synthase